MSKFIRTLFLVYLVLGPSQVFSQNDSTSSAEEVYEGLKSKTVKCLKACDTEHKSKFRKLVSKGKRYCRREYKLCNQLSNVVDPTAVSQKCAQCINNHYLPIKKNETPFIQLKVETNTCKNKCYEDDPGFINAGPKVEERHVNTCPELRPYVAQHFKGNKLLTECYMKLFLKETSCRPWLTQSANVPGNSYTGYGICTIEKPPSVRKGRGPECSQINTIDGQIRCCRKLMRSTSKVKSYFGPVRIGRQTKCE